MRIDVIRYQPHTSSLKAIIDFYTAANLFHRVILRERTKHKASTLRIHDGVCFETLNILHIISCEMFTFFDVLREMKQKTQTNPREHTVRTGNDL